MLFNFVVVVSCCNTVHPNPILLHLAFLSFSLLQWYFVWRHVAIQQVLDHACDDEESKEGHAVPG